MSGHFSNLKNTTILMGCSNVEVTSLSPDASSYDTYRTTGTATTTKPLKTKRKSAFVLVATLILARKKSATDGNKRRNQVTRECLTARTRMKNRHCLSRKRNNYKFYLYLHILFRYKYTGSSTLLNMVGLLWNYHNILCSCSERLLVQFTNIFSQGRGDGGLRGAVTLLQ